MNTSYLDSKHVTRKKIRTFYRFFLCFSIYIHVSSVFHPLKSKYKDKKESFPLKCNLNLKTRDFSHHIASSSSSSVTSSFQCNTLEEQLTQFFFCLFLDTTGFLLPLDRTMCYIFIEHTSKSTVTLSIRLHKRQKRTIAPSSKNGNTNASTFKVNKH